jgi:RNA polymerase sigma factor (sigma-70 family)
MEPRAARVDVTDDDRAITATVLRERNRLSNFIRRRVRDRADADDILQDVFSEFVEAYHLPAPIERASAWLFRVARNRIIDLFRKKREQSLEASDGEEVTRDGEYRLDLLLPAADGGPEAAYARSVLLAEMQEAMDELPADQREVFVAHELEGASFKELALKSGVPINTLLARKRYAVLHLRERLQSIYDELEM